MMMRKMMVAVLVVCLMSANLESVAPQVNCYDACSTGCVQADLRLMDRCERKCQIRCGPDSRAESEPTAGGGLN